MNDITTKDDVSHFVHTFYHAVKEDNLIGPVFNAKIETDKWPEHLNKMTDFWSMVLLGEGNYRGRPFRHHIGLGIGTSHFDRWISLFNKTIQDNFNGPTAQEAIKRAQTMRVMFESKLNHIKSNTNTFPIVW